MALLSRDQIINEDLENWVWIASGGFGDVYKARHKRKCCDVAIKLLRHDVSSVLTTKKAVFNEATNMDKVSSEFVLRVYGIYDGYPPGGTTPKQGIVTEFMRKGSLETLQKGNFPDTPPWALVFRLAFQIALGINSLHSENLLHGDIKPSNILLNNDLHARLADFGLSRHSSSASNSEEMSKDIGGTYKYMPPEAFVSPYKPSRTFDIYSYGILLWSIVAGEEPYSGRKYADVKNLICKGHRPCVKDFQSINADGMKELLVLMQQCWDQDLSKRPKIEKLTEDTEKLFLRHEKDIRAAVYDVVTKLESRTSHKDHKTPVEAAFFSPTPDASSDVVDHPACAAQDISVETVCQQTITTLTTEEKETFVDDNMAVLIQDTDMVMAITEEIRKMVHNEAYSMIKAKETNQQKMRVLYDGPLRSGGKKVKAAFYDALLKHQHDLVARLG